MSTRAANYLEAVEHLPGDAVLVLHDVSWEEYQGLLKEMEENWPGMRVTYNKGRLEIMSPSPKHERIKAFVDHLVAVFCDETGLAMENFGSTTYHRKRDARGAEPDACFYVTDLDRIIGKDEIDLDRDPPPDVVVEIDIANQSFGKFEIYAGFGVPEIWRYDDRRMHIHRFTGKRYIEIQSSRFFSGLTAAVLTDFIGRSKTQGRTAALAAFRKWVRAKQVNGSRSRPNPPR